MKKTIVISVLLGAAVVLCAETAMAGWIAHTRVSQHRRIDQGVVSGELTRAETAALVREQHTIQVHTRKALSDGVLTNREKSLLSRDRARASAHIYHLKHNRWSR